MIYGNGVQVKTVGEDFFKGLATQTKSGDIYCTFHTYRSLQLALEKRLGSLMDDVKSKNYFDLLSDGIRRDIFEETQLKGLIASWEEEERRVTKDFTLKSRFVSADISVSELEEFMKPKVLEEIYRKRASVTEGLLDKILSCLCCACPRGTLTEDEGSMLETDKRKSLAQLFVEVETSGGGAAEEGAAEERKASVDELQFEYKVQLLAERADVLAEGADARFTDLNLNRGQYATLFKILLN